MERAQMRCVASPVICKKCGKPKQHTKVQAANPAARDRNDSTEPFSFLAMPKPYSRVLEKAPTDQRQPGRDGIVRNAAGVPLVYSTALARRGTEIRRAR